MIDDVANMCDWHDTGCFFISCSAVPCIICLTFTSHCILAPLLLIGGFTASFFSFLYISVTYFSCVLLPVRAIFYALVYAGGAGL